VPVLIASQLQGLHQGQGGGRALGFGDRHGAVQPDHIGVGQVSQLSVERGDLRPVELWLSLQRGDRRLDGVLTTAERGRIDQGAVQQDAGLLDLPPVPSGPVLVREQDQVLAVEPGRAARVMQQHQRQQAEYLGLGRKQAGQHAA
jgi:hypothetical protein